MDGKRASDKLGRTGEQLEKEAIKFKEAYEALKWGETVFATIFQEVPVAMLLLDRERHIREINRRGKLLNTFLVILLVVFPDHRPNLYI